MAVDRTWYNTLVDDNGTGTTGTIWNKAAVNSLLNAVDAALAIIDGKNTAWATVAFSAANFTASSGTWVLAAGDQTVFRWKIVDKIMFIDFVLDATTVTGTPANLRIAIPASKVATVDTFSGGLLYNSNGGGWLNTGAMFVTAGATFVALQAGALGVGTWANATDNTYVRGFFAFEIT